MLLVSSMYLVSGISGSKAADMAAVAPVLFQDTKAQSQPGGLVALLAATGAQTEMIRPPAPRSVRWAVCSPSRRSRASVRVKPVLASQRSPQLQ